MSDKKEKAPDEIYCRSCGEPIKKEAEICPHCGVRQEGISPSTPQTTPSKTYSPSHDPSQYETTVSNTWWYGVAAGLFLWVIAYVFAGVGGSGPLGGVGGGLMVLAWIILPISAYFDIQYIRANAKWNPHTALWVILLLIPAVNIVTSAIYLYRRYEVFGRH